MNERLFDEIQEFRVVLDLGLELLLICVANVWKRHTASIYLDTQNRHAASIYLDTQETHTASIYLDLGRKRIDNCKVKCPKYFELPLTREIA